MALGFFRWAFRVGLLALGFSLSGFCSIIFELRFPCWAFRVGRFALVFSVGLLAFGFPRWAFRVGCVAFAFPHWVVSPWLFHVGCLAFGFPRWPFGFQRSPLAVAFLRLWI